jgi:hypothetical protein
MRVTVLSTTTLGKPCVVTTHHPHSQYGFVLNIEEEDKKCDPLKYAFLDLEMLFRGEGATNYYQGVEMENGSAMSITLKRDVQKYKNIKIIKGFRNGSIGLLISGTVSSKQMVRFSVKYKKSSDVNHDKELCTTTPFFRFHTFIFRYTDKACILSEEFHHWICIHGSKNDKTVSKANNNLLKFGITETAFDKVQEHLKRIESRYPYSMDVADYVSLIVNQSILPLPLPRAPDSIVKIRKGNPSKKSAKSEQKTKAPKAPKKRPRVAQDEDEQEELPEKRAKPDENTAMLMRQFKDICSRPVVPSNKVVIRNKQRIHDQNIEIVEQEVSNFDDDEFK